MDKLTLVHVVLSLIGIVSGFIVLFGLLMSNRLNSWTAVFLVSTAATSVTGFFFPFHQFTPGIAVGIISLVVLTVASVARYRFHMAGAWRWIYVTSAMVALYLNVFVGIVQAFQTVPFLKAAAPTQTEPAFLFTQLLTLALFVVVAIIAAVKFHLEPVRR